jgi:mitochondrial import inner membrane translocase subunit TIM13
MDKFTPEQQQQALQQAKMTLAQQSMQQMLQQTSKLCFDKCVTSPSSSLSKREETCLAMCYDKHQAVLQTVIKSLSNR